METVVKAEREGRFKDAFRDCERGLARFPDDYYLLMKRIAQARHASDRSSAESLLPRAVSQCPETAATLTSVGDEYAFLGHFEEAEQFFRRALDRLSGSGLVREKLAMALIQQQKLEEGLEELEAALAAEPANAERRNLLAQALLHFERPEAVVELLEAAPPESLTWESLTCLSIARARLDGANELADQLLHPAAGGNLVGTN